MQLTGEDSTEAGVRHNRGSLLESPVLWERAGNLCPIHKVHGCSLLLLWPSRSCHLAQQRVARCASQGPGGIVEPASVS